MAHIGLAVAEVQLLGPDGKTIIWLAQDGRTHLLGPRPLGDRAWWVDRLKALAHAVRSGKAPRGFVLMAKGSKGPIKGNPMILKLLSAARDVVRHAELQSYRREEPDANRVLEAIKSPYRVR